MTNKPVCGNETGLPGARALYLDAVQLFDGLSAIEQLARLFPSEAPIEPLTQALMAVAGKHCDNLQRLEGSTDAAL